VIDLKIILFASILFVLAGCANYQTESHRADDVPVRSARRNIRRSAPAPIPIPKAEAVNASPPVHRTERVTRSQTVEASVASPAPSANENAANSGAHYETKFDTADKGRESNIALASSSINNTVIQPGETFSFNDTIGSTTGERGYKKSVIFVDGKKSKGYGGGVCQVSTTLCNAAHHAGMTIVERHDHSRPVNYVGDGLQAATSHNGGLDFKFKNDTQHPVVIHAKAENGTVSISVSAA
jgi:vancomycin resistance protein YoaR